MALANRTPLAGLLHHSDRGSQYAAASYQLLLTTDGITTSMSRRGNCWDNACVESFFGTLKRELVYHRHCATREDATQDIFEYIKVFYNRKHRRSAMTPWPSTKRGPLWRNQGPQNWGKVSSQPIAYAAFNSFTHLLRVPHDSH